LFAGFFPLGTVKVENGGKGKEETGKGPWERQINGWLFWVGCDGKMVRMRGMAAAPPGKKWLRKIKNTHRRRG